MVFTGHAGLAKSSVLDRLCEHIKTVEPGSSANWYSAEQNLWMETFLDEDRESQSNRWRESLRSAMDKWDDERPDYAFLSLHLSYQRFSRTLLPLTWQTQRTPASRPTSLTFFLKRYFQPHYFVCLIDDLPSVQWRIQREGKFSLPLQQLFGWRNLETQLTDYVAQEVVSQSPEARTAAHYYPFERSPLVAVRHPPQMLFRLIGKPESVRVYASFPIGTTRRNKAYQEQIDRFRNALHKDFTVFDPLSIDELPLSDIAKMGDYSDYRNARWPLSNTLCNPDDEPVPVNQAEARQVVSSPYGVPSILSDQIETRDFRLIEQADCIVTYRPQFRGDGAEPREDFSEGTKNEWEFARRLGRARFLIHDPAEDGPLNNEAFHSKGGMAPYRFDQIGNLSNPENQAKVLEQVIGRLKQESSQIRRTRMPSAG